MVSTGEAEINRTLQKILQAVEKLTKKVKKFNSPVNSVITVNSTGEAKVPNDFAKYK